MSTTDLTLDEIHDLAHGAMTANGCNEANAAALADIVMRAERDGSHSHGLFRIPGYVKALKQRQGRWHRHADRDEKAPGGDPVRGAWMLCAAGAGDGAAGACRGGAGDRRRGAVADRHPPFRGALAGDRILADRGLVGIACTAYMPMVAPAGSATKLFGTNPISFAWPRPGRDPVCYDMATAAMAMGDVQIAARDGREVPLGTGLDADGNATTDPARIAAGVLLPFGGYKGSAIALMVELLAAGLTGERFSYEAKEADNGDGGPPRGGEMVIALSPELIAGPGWEDHVEGFMDRLTGA